LFIYYGSHGFLLVFGLLFGSMLVEWASYHWVFWFVAILAIPVALASVFIIPPQISKTSGNLEPGAAKWKSLDLVGVSIMTGMNILANSFLHRSRALIVALILFVFAVTSGSTDGWASAVVLAPLVISILMVVAFFYWETLLPVDKAAMYVTGDTLHSSLADYVSDHPGCGFTTISLFSSLSHSCQCFGGVRCSGYL
jgi:energy-coupling factor transporter transmembrane protein EcfT